MKENCSKHEALVKATALAGDNAVIASPPPPASKLFVEQSEIPQGGKADNLDKIAVLSKVFGYYKSGLPSSKKAVIYLTQTEQLIQTIRDANIRQTEITIQRVNP